MGYTSTALRSARTTLAPWEIVSTAQGIRDARRYGDAEAAKAGTTLLQTFLVKQVGEWLDDNSDTILAAFEALEGWQNSNGRRLASYLMVHTRDDAARVFWAGIEDALDARN